MFVEALEVMLTDGQKMILGKGIFTANSDEIIHCHTEKINATCNKSDITTILNKYIMSYTYTTKDYN